MKRLKCDCRREKCRERFDCRRPKNWYAAFEMGGTWYGQSLKARENQKTEAAKNLGKLIEKAERGEKPSDLNRIFRNALPVYYEWCADEGEKSQSAIVDIKYRVEAKRVKGSKKSADSNLMAHFGDLAIKEITRGAVKLYKVDREEQGAPKDTITKELRIVKEVCQIFNPSFVLPKFKRWANRGKRVHSTLSYSEV